MRKLIAISLFLLLLFPTIAGCQDLKWISVNDFSGGLNDDVSTWELANNEATDLLNVYVDEIEKGIVKRKGYTKANSTTTTSNYWLQTSSTDWSAGSLVNIDTTTVVDTYRLKTSYWTQTSASDFASGTLVNIDTVTVSGTFRVAKTTEAVQQQFTTNNSSWYGYEVNLAQSFKPSIDCICTKIEIYIRKVGSPGNLSVYLKADDNNSPGSTLASATISAGDVSGTLVYEIANITDTNLTTDTRYWIYVAKTGDASNHYRWGYNSPGSYANGNFWSDVGHCANDDFNFKVYEQHYESSSNLTSQIGDLGIKPESWESFEVTETLNGCMASYWVRTSSYTAGISDASWHSVYPHYSLPESGAPLNQYIQWIVVLLPTNTETPVVEDITINGKITGSLTSQYHDCGSDIQQWGRLEANHTLNGQTITYAVRTSSYSGGLSLADWYEVESGNNITAPVNQYAQWISTLTSTGSQTPVVNNVTIYWESTPISVFDEPITSLHRLKKSDGSEYMWAVSSGTIYGSADAGTFSSVKSGMSTTYDVNWTNLGDSAYCVDGSTWAQKFTAYDSCTAVTTVPRGRFIIEEGYRLWIGYASGYPNRLYYSDLADDSTWDWVYIPGEGEITGLGKLQGSPIVYKTNSAWKVIGTQVTTEEDVYFVPSLVNLSSEIGCINHRSIQNFRLKEYTVQLFLGKDNVYATNGVSVVPIGDKIENTIEDLKQASFASSYSWLQTVQTDWEAGTYGTTTLDTSGIELKLEAQDTDSEFNAGTKSSVTVSSNQIKLTKDVWSTEAIDQQQVVGTSERSVANLSQAQSFKPSIDYTLTKVKIHIKKWGDHLNDLTVYLKADSGNFPGTTLSSATITASTIPESYSDITIDFSDTTLTKDTQYWILIPQIGNTDYTYRWMYSPGNPYTRGGSCVGEVTLRPEWDFRFKVYEKHYIYQSSGDFTSQALDYGSVPNSFGNLAGDLDVPSNTTLKFKTASSTYSTGGFDIWEYVGSAGEDGGAINSTVRQYLKWKSYFTSTDGGNSSTINSVYVGGVPFISQYHDCGTGITHWGNFVVNSILNNQTISYQVRSSTWSGAIDGTSWYDVVPNGLIPCLVNRYVQWKAIFNTTDGTQNPTLNDVSVYWWAGAFSGSSPASVVYDNRYHLFAMTSGSDVNDIDLVLNEDGAWTKNDIGADSAVIYNEKLYTGSSTTTVNGSWLYEQDIGYSDDLQPINSYWQSKDYDLGIPYKDKTLRKIWTVAKKSGSYPLRMDYIIDKGYSSTNYNVWLSSGVAIATDERHIPSEMRGKFFSFKVSNNGENQPWELYRIDCGFQPSPGGSEP